MIISTMFYFYYFAFMTISHFKLCYEPFADISKWQVIIFSKNCLRRLTGPYHPQ